MNSDGKTTHFGYQQVDDGDKAARVAGVFDSVASKYDLMNDLMSAGAHRLWKRATVELAAIRPGQKVLDLAGGTGDLAARFSPLLGEDGQLVLADINRQMLEVGRNRLLDRGLCAGIHFVQADAEILPFPPGSFDCVSIAFGLRNVTNKERALTAMREALKSGGRALILEFSKPHDELLGRLYDAFSFSVLPRLGKLVTGDEASYRYLVESIRMHPDQDTLLEMMEDAGFVRCDYHDMSGGIVAVHRGFCP